MNLSRKSRTLTTTIFLCSFLLGVAFCLFSASSLGPVRAFAASPEIRSVDPEDEADVKISDPLEKFNRAMFQFNDKMFLYFMRPVGKVYGMFLPEPFRVSIRNAFGNAKVPVRVVNCSLQGKFSGAGIELARFFINTTMGIGGLFDVAEKDFSLHAHDEDFGQTLGVWGVGSGFYLVLPFLGPSSLRDGIGTGVDALMDPLIYTDVDLAIQMGLFGGNAINEGSLRIDEYMEFRKAALDPYISMRHGYINSRNTEIKK